MPFVVRRYHPSDLPALYRICRATAGDATETLDDDLPGQQYLGAYLAFEPRLAFVASSDGEPIGYIVGTADTTAFAARCETDWYPLLRERHPLPADDDASPDAGFVRALHAGVGVEPISASHPAHLHINLLPVGRGGGVGRRLVERFTLELDRLGTGGVHLVVGASNAPAISFYERLGFREVAAGDGTAVYARRLAG